MASTAQKAARPPLFDREQALSTLTAWYGLASATIDQLYLLTEDLRVELERSPEMQQLIDMAAFNNLHGDLDSASEQIIELAPQVLPSPLAPRWEAPRRRR